MQPITVKLRQDAVAQVSGEQAVGPAAQEVLDVVERYGASLVQVDPRASDPSLRTFFRVDPADASSVASLREALDPLEAVEGAYIKPPDAAP